MSNAERFRRIDELFAKALEHPPAERAACLDEACAGDAELRREIEALLAADARAGRFLEPRSAAPPPPDRTPDRIGPYRLLREIGSGGMGTVYLAQRDDEQYEREVAIKILRPGTQAAEAVHRFLAERQILARLQHPGIARLYDGGTTEDGRPFLVMELVDGLPLDEHCDRHQLPVDARLGLFLRVCAAVQHAHQNLLVHRDLKPANILVNAEGEPRLLDFGIAKQLAPEGAEISSLTRTGSRVMTPSYASPEQVRGEPVTTATDVYSLGVLLYELLAGRSPYGAASGLPYEIERAICELEPERPSQAVSRPGEPPPEAIARARGASLTALRRKLQGDLDTIVLTALRKDPARRYASAAKLAADLENHLRHLPVAARPDTLLYRTRKLLRRRRGAAVAAALAALVALGFVLGLIEQGRRLARERDKARYALDFLVDTFREADPYQRQGRSLTAQEILDQGAARVSRELAGQPEVQAAVMKAIGEVDLGLGRADAAADLLARVVELRRQSPAADPLELAASLEPLASARYQQSDFPAAEALLREAVALRREAGSDPVALAKALNQLGVVISTRETTAEVAALHQEALDLARRSQGPAGPEVAESLILLGRLAGDQGDYERAERLYREGLAVQRKALAPDDPKALRNEGELAVILLDGGKPQEAEDLLLANLQRQRQALGSDHPDLIHAFNNLGMARDALGNQAGAEAAYREALALPRNSADAGTDMLRGAVLGNLATTLQAQNRIDESVPLLVEALELRRRSLGDRHPLVAQALLHLARAERLRGRWAPGLDLARQALALVEQAEGPNHPHVAFPLREIGNNLLAQRDAAGAEPYLRRALEIRRRELPAGHPDVALAQLTLGNCLIPLGREAEAESLWREGRAALAAQFGAGDKRVQRVDADLAILEKKRRERKLAPAR